MTLKRAFIKARGREVGEIRQAVELLRQARALLAGNECRNAADKVRKAMKSAEGALRNAQSQNGRPGRAPILDRCGVDRSPL